MASEEAMLQIHPENQENWNEPMNTDTRRALELQIEQPIGDGRFKILDGPEDSQAMPPTVANPIGEGGTATVYRCRQRLANSFAIRVVKFLNPTNEIIEKRAQADQTEGHSAFVTEIANLSELNHQNLVRIIDAGVHEGTEFFVMDYVSGPTLAQVCDEKTKFSAEWRQRANQDPFEPIRMVRQVCWALSYLHERGYYHMDVAPKNIFVSKIDGKPHVVLGDLGVAKRLRGLGINPEDLVVAAGTRKYCPPSAQAIRNTTIPISQLMAVAEQWDCYSIGELIIDMLAIIPVRTDLRTVALLATQIKRKPEKYTAAEIANELSRLMPEQLTTLGVDELSAASVGSITSISIPLYAVPISGRVGRIIDHPTFSRLRLIPQLLLVRTVYPGAQHTRFEHALGSYELARQVLLQLISEPDFLLEFKAAELETTLVTVLLVHLSAFQLHHIFEEALPKGQLQLTNAAGQSVSILEWFLDWTPVPAAVIAPFEKATSSVESEKVISLRTKINQVFPRVNIQEVLDVLTARTSVQLPINSKPSLRIISSIVRSSIDVRGMDYMVRDAHHAGVDSGTNVDIAQIIRCMRVLRDPYKLVITRRGVHAVENLLCARYWMYSRVYWNDLNRSMFTMLRYAVIKLFDAEAFSFVDFVQSTLASDERGAIEFLLRHCPNNQQFTSVREILELLLLPRPRSFRTLLEITQHDEGTPSKLIDAYRERSPRELEPLYDQFTSLLKADLGISVQSGDLLVDVPRDPLDKLGADVDVLFGDQCKSLVSASKIVESLPEAFKTSAVKLRVFWSHRLRKSAEASGIELGKIRQTVKTVLHAWL